MIAAVLLSLLAGTPPNAGGLRPPARAVLSAATRAAAPGAGQDALPAPAAPARGGRQSPTGRGPRRPLPPNPNTMTAQQVEEYFDAAVLFQAQAELRLSDDEFLTFGARLRRLQTLRRTVQRQRLQAIRGLNELLGTAGASDDAIAAKVAALDALDADAARQLHDARAGIDEVLTVRQRARFRVFEETMERRKLDLLARARAQTRRQATPAAQAP